MMTKDILLQNFRFSHFVLMANVEGITHAESLRPAAPGASSLNWIVGHVVRSRHDVLALADCAPALDPSQLARYERDQPAMTRDGDGVLPFDTLVAAFDASQKALVARLETITDDELAAPCRHVLDPAQQSRVAVQLAGLSFHEAYHAGQTGLARRIIGKPSRLPARRA